MRQEIINYNRLDLFNSYHSKTNPFSFVTTKMDITKLYNLIRKEKNSYATIGYYIALAANQVDAFKYRYEDGKIYKYDVIKPNFTQMFDDNTIGYFTCDMKDDYHAFIDEYNNILNKFLKNHQSYDGNDSGEIWLSCEPWFNFTGVITPFDKEITIPQVIWDKFMFDGDKCYINMMIMVHHGFADGYHIGLFINKFKELIDNIII